MRLVGLLPVALVVFAMVGCSDRATSSPAATDSPSVSACQGPSTSSAPATQASPRATPTASPTPASATRGDLGPAAPDGARTMAQMRALTRGERVSGTPGEATATDYIANQLRSYGYSVEVTPFGFEGLRLRPATVSGGGHDLEVITLGGSGTARVSGVAAYVGVGDRAGVAGQDLTGKVAIAERGDLKFFEKYDNTIGCGAVALIVINNQEGSFSGTLTRDVDQPVVAAPDSIGPELRQLGQSGATLTVDVPAGSSLESRNVLARPRPGADCRVLVGGHHDGVPGTVAANDNASGSAQVIELARAFAADGLDDGLCFATFGGEEEGLFGSKAMATAFRDASHLPAAMVNLDVTGIGDEVELIGDDHLRDVALQLADRLDIPARRSSLPANSGSDHQSFSALGVPVLFFTSGEFPTIHSPKDVPADIQLDELERVGDLAFAAIGKILDDAS